MFRQHFSIFYFTEYLELCKSEDYKLVVIDATSNVSHLQQSYQVGDNGISYILSNLNTYSPQNYVQSD